MGVQNTMPVYETEQGYIDTWGVGGDRFAFLPSSMFSPTAFLGTTDPSTLALLSIPPTYDQVGYGVNGQGNSAAARGASAPWNPKASIVPWVLAALVVGWFGIHRLYYHKHR